MTPRRLPVLIAALGFALGSGMRGRAAPLSADLKDPTQPPISRQALPRSPGSPHMPIVSAIFVSPTRSVAVFDDQPVHAGDHVGEYRIDAVLPYGVRYTTRGRTAFARLNTAR